MYRAKASQSGKHVTDVLGSLRPLKSATSTSPISSHPTETAPWSFRKDDRDWSIKREWPANGIGAAQYVVQAALRIGGQNPWSSSATATHLNAFPHRYPHHRSLGLCPLGQSQNGSFFKKVVLRSLFSKSHKSTSSRGDNHQRQSRTALTPPTYGSDGFIDSSRS